VKIKNVNSRMVKLEEICIPKQWKTISSSELTKEGYPVYGANGVIGFYSKFNHEVETLLVTCRGATCGCLNICSPKSYVNGNAMALDNLADCCDIKYLYYYLQNRGFADVISGSAQPQIIRTTLQKIEIPLPLKVIQKQIVKTLDTVAELLTMHKQRLTEMDNLIKSIFFDMFGDPVTNKKDWDVVELGLVASLQGGFAFKSKDYIDNGIKLVQIANVHKDTLTWEETNYLPIGYLTKYSNFVLKENDIVLAMTRPIIKSLDAVKIAQVSKKDIPCLLNQRVGRFKINYDAINKTFLLEFCKSQYFKNAIELFGSNSLQPNVSSKQVESVRCFLPPISLQNKFAETVTKIEEQKALVQKAIDETQYLFDSLMSQYFD
jgi:type I restriction enzyme S subunit